MNLRKYRGVLEAFRLMPPTLGRLAAFMLDNVFLFLSVALLCRMRGRASWRPPCAPTIATQLPASHEARGCAQAGSASAFGTLLVNVT